MLTVVVPVYNVSSYVDECLASLAGQTLRDIEIVVVDDGSTDDSPARVAAWAARDPRITVVTQRNAGLGAARNTGAARGTRPYLAFVDADDILPEYAFEVLVGALERTGSDFASGDVRLLGADGLTPSPLHRGTHRVTRLGAVPREHRYLLYDRLACNKVFRRRFWDGTEFPAGVHYEDIPVTIPAYGRAAAVDVLALPVYYWRQRPAGDKSISQRLAEQKNLEDRFAAVATARAALDPELATWYAETALQSDLRLVLEVLPEADDAYRERFLKLASDFLADVDPAVLTRLPSRLAAAWRLTAAGDLAGVVATVTATRGPVTGMAAWRDPAPPETVLTGAEWAGGRLHLRTAGAPSPIGLIWLRERPAGGTAAADADRRAVVLGARGRGGRMGAVLRPDRLRGPDGWRPGEWTANVAPAQGASRALLKVRDRDLPLAAAWVDDSVRLVPVVRSGVLRLRVERPATVATAVDRDGDTLVVTLAGTAGGRLVLERTPGLPFAAYPVDSGGDGATARIPLADLTAATRTRPPIPGEPPPTWRVALASGDGPAEPLVAGPALTATRLGPVEVDADPAGHLTLSATQALSR